MELESKCSKKKSFRS